MTNELQEYQHHQFVYSLLPTNTSDISKECILIKIFHRSSLHNFAIFFQCTFKLTNTKNHIMITHKKFVHSCLKYVTGRCCCNMVLDGRSIWGNPSWFIYYLPEAKELIKTANMLRIIISRQFRGPYGEITVCISKKDSFLSFFVEIRENFFYLIEGSYTVTRWYIPRNDEIRFTFRQLHLHTKLIQDPHWGHHFSVCMPVSP